MQVYYDQDADLQFLKGKKAAVLGYGSQGHAHANNLRDSGIDVVVGLKRGSSSWPKAEKAGLKVMETAEAAKLGDIVMVLLPDELQGEAYEKEIGPGLKQGNYLAFGHGFNIHFKRIVPPAGVNVFMVAPKAPGHLLRSEFEKGRGVPCLLAVHQDAPGRELLELPAEDDPGRGGGGVEEGEAAGQALVEDVADDRAERRDRGSGAYQDRETVLVPEAPGAERPAEDQGIPAPEREEGARSGAGTLHRHFQVAGFQGRGGDGVVAVRVRGVSGAQADRLSGPETEVRPFRQVETERLDFGGFLEDLADGDSGLEQGSSPWTFAAPLGEEGVGPDEIEITFKPVLDVHRDHFRNGGRVVLLDEIAQFGQQGGPGLDDQQDLLGALYLLLPPIDRRQSGDDVHAGGQMRVDEAVGNGIRGLAVRGGHEHYAVWWDHGITLLVRIERSVRMRLA